MEMELSYKGEKLIMCDYCPRVMHLKRCAKLIANYKGEYKCPKCEEEGNQTKTEEGENHRGKNYNQTNENKGKRRTNINDRRVFRSCTKENKGRRDNKDTERPKHAT